MQDYFASRFNESNNYMKQQQQGNFDKQKNDFNSHKPLGIYKGFLCVFASLRENLNT